MLTLNSLERSPRHCLDIIVYTAMATSVFAVGYRFGDVGYSRRSRRDGRSYAGDCVGRAGRPSSVLLSEQTADGVFDCGPGVRARIDQIKMAGS